MKRPLGGAGTVVVFAKAPRAGRVKTRMCPPLSPAQAAALYSAMLADVLEATGAFAAALGLEPVLALDPASEAPQWVSRVPRGYRVIGQRGRSLAERMSEVAAQEAGPGRGPLLLRGSDSPALSRESLEQALAALETCDIALAPDPDGGYSLIGLVGAWPGLFSHPMSTGHVLDDTLAQARRLGARTSLVEGGFDLDRFEDLRALGAIRESPGASLCPRTLAYLDEAKLWPEAAGERGETA